MSKLLIIRAGQGSYGDHDYDVLTATGQAQARALAGELATRGVTASAMVTGTQSRHRDTIAPLAGSLPVSVDPRWNEFDVDALLEAYADTPARLSVPGAPYVEVDMFAELLDYVLLRWIAGPTPAGVEDWLSFSTRVGAAAEDLLARLGPGESAVVCTSAGVIAALCSRLLGLRGSGFLSFHRSIANTGVTEVLRDRRGDSMLSFNDHGHLGRPGGPPLTFR